MRAFAFLTCALALLTSCSDEAGPKIDALHFPAVVLFGNASQLVCREPGQLTNMHSNYIVLGRGTPVLIDSNFTIYSLERLRSTHSSLWLMAHPSGATDVTFDLKPENFRSRSGPAVIRAPSGRS